MQLEWADRTESLVHIDMNFESWSKKIFPLRYADFTQINEE